VDCLSLDEAVDFEKARKILGPNFCLMGNVSTTLMAMGGSEEVEEATKAVVQKAGKNGPLFISGGCILPEICPADNIRAMVKATREYQI
jgi:uroporphyrinogen-III decarboxylase